MNYLLDQANLREKNRLRLCWYSWVSHRKPPDERMAAAAASQLGIKLRVKLASLKSDFKTFNLILAMDQENYQDILALDPGRQYRDKVRLMCEFCFRHPSKEVPDPYYGGRAIQSCHRSTTRCL